MTAPTTEKQADSNMLIERWEQIGAKLSSLAEEFPEEKYESALVTGARTFGDVLRHVAFWNLYAADSVRGEKADDSANELPKAKYPGKKQVIAVLNRSVSAGAAALREQRNGLDSVRAALAVSFLEHMCEHYGQLAVYARLAGVVPPASRS